MGTHLKDWLKAIHQIRRQKAIRKLSYKRNPITYIDSFSYNNMPTGLTIRNRRPQGKANFPESLESGKAFHLTTRLAQERKQTKFSLRVTRDKAATKKPLKPLADFEHFERD
jgi:hypothetical protein